MTTHNIEWHSHVGMLGHGGATQFRGAQCWRRVLSFPLFLSR